jgi:6-phosphofructokinase
VLATRLGMAAVDAAVDGAWGSMVTLRGTDIARVSIAEATGDLNLVPQSRYDEARILFG